MWRWLTFFSSFSKVISFHLQGVFSQWPLKEKLNDIACRNYRLLLSQSQVLLQGKKTHCCQSYLRAPIFRKLHPLKCSPTSYRQTEIFQWFPQRRYYLWPGFMICIFLRKMLSFKKGSNKFEKSNTEAFSIY